MNAEERTALIRSGCGAASPAYGLLRNVSIHFATSSFHRYGYGALGIKDTVDFYVPDQ